MVARTRGARRQAPSPPRDNEAAAAATRPRPPQSAKELRAAWALMESEPNEPEPEPEPGELMSPGAADTRSQKSFSVYCVVVATEGFPAPAPLIPGRVSWLACKALDLLRLGLPLRGNGAFQSLPSLSCCLLL